MIWVFASPVMWSEFMATSMVGDALPRHGRMMARALACAALFAASVVAAQQPPPETTAPEADKPASAAGNSPVLSGKGPLRLPEPATAQPGVAKSFTPTEKVRVDAEVDRKSVV